MRMFVLEFLAAHAALISLYLLSAYLLIRFGSDRIATLVSDFHGNLKSGARNDTWAIVIVVLMVYAVALEIFMGPPRIPDSPLSSAVGQTWSGIKAGGGLTDGHAQERLSQSLGIDLSKFSGRAEPATEGWHASWGWTLVLLPWEMLLAMWLVFIFTDNIFLSIAAIFAAIGSRTAAAGTAMSGGGDAPGGGNATPASATASATGFYSSMQRLFNWIGDDLISDFASNGLFRWIGRRS